GRPERRRGGGGGRGPGGGGGSGGGEPWALRAAPRLEGRDRRFVGQREGDLVLAGEQALLLERVHVESDPGAVRAGQRLGREVDAHRRARALAELAAERRTRLGRDHDRERPVLRAV